MAVSISNTGASTAAILAPSGIFRATGRECFRRARYSARSPSDSVDGGDYGCCDGEDDEDWVGRSAKAKLGAREMMTGVILIQIGHHHLYLPAPE